MNHVELKSVTIRDHWLLGGVSFEMKDCLLILGPALAGKSTLARALGGVGESAYGSRSDMHYSVETVVDVFWEGKEYKGQKWVITPGRHVAEWPSIADIYRFQALDWFKAWRARDPSTDSAHADCIWTLQNTVKPGGWSKERYEFVMEYARAFFRYVQGDLNSFQLFWDMKDWWDTPDSYRHWMSLLVCLADPNSTLLVLDNAFGRMDVYLWDLVFEAVVSAACDFEKQIIMLTHDPCWAYNWMKYSYPDSDRWYGRRKIDATGASRMLFLVRDYEAGLVRMMPAPRAIVRKPERLLENWTMDVTPRV
jgi:hypothetical protein